MNSDTSMGGSRSEFPQTSAWAVLQSGEGWEARFQRHLECLARAYWKPIYCFIRRGWSRSDADAKDLTQSFWIHLQEHDLLRRFDPARSSFRTYLKRCLGSFLGTMARDASRQKRGGGRDIVSLHQGAADGVAAADATPEQAFDREWASELLERSLRDLEARFTHTGRRAYFEVLRLYTLAGEGDRPTYGAVAKQLGLSEADVGNYLRTARQALRDCVLDAIGEYVPNGDAEAELDMLLGPER